MEFEELLQDLNEKEEKIFKFEDLYCQKVVEAEEIRCMHILGQIDENERIYQLKQNEKEQIEFDNERYKNLFFVATVYRSCLNIALDELTAKITAMPDTEEKKELLRYTTLISNYFAMTNNGDIPKNTKLLAEVVEQAKEEYRSKVMANSVNLSFAKNKIKHDLSLSK